MKKINRTINYLLCCVYIFCSSFLGAKAQVKQVTPQNLVWFSYNNNIRFSEKWSLISEIFERRFITPFKHHHFLTRIHLHYALAKGWDVGAGITFSFQSPQDPLSLSTVIVPEYRPHLELNNKFHFKRVNIHNRLRLEQRFIHNTTNGELSPGYTNSYRFRYYLGFDFILKEIDGERKLKFRVSDEIHFNAGKNIDFGTFDQNRVYMAISFDISGSLAIEMGLLHWYQRLRTGYQYYNRNIIRIGISHRINLQKSTSP